MSWRRLNQLERCVKSVFSRLLNLENAVESTKGWWSIYDNTHTSINPLNIPASITTKLIINSDLVVDEFGAQDVLLDSRFINSSCKVDESNVGDSYLFRLSFSIKSTNMERDFSVVLDTGLKTIFEVTKHTDKGIDMKVHIVDLIVIEEPFSENGGAFYINSDETLDIFDISLIVQRVTSVN